MSVNCHNSGRICWNTLADSIRIEWDREDHNGKLHYKYSLDLKKAEHFASVLHKVIKEFAETYKKEDNETESFNLNPTKWHWNDCKYGGGAQISYTKSLLCIYMDLNLILLDTKLNETTLLKRWWIYSVCMGESDYRHEDYMASECRNIIRKLFGCESMKFSEMEDRNINLSSKELVEEIREYLKKVFICLIRIFQSKKHNDTLEEADIYQVLRWNYDL